MEHSGKHKVLDPGVPTDCPRPSATIPPWPRRRRILVVEDNRVNQRLLKKLIEKRGHEVLVADNGADAILALERRGHFVVSTQAHQPRIDLVLMDIQMPILGGIAATHQIRLREHETGYHLPIIALTAHASVGQREEYLGQGLDECLTKPIDAKTLYHVICAFTAAVEATPLCDGF